MDLGPIRSIIQGPIPLQSVNLKVKDVISPHGWCWSGRSTIPFDLPQDIKENIQAIPFPIAARSVDKLAWKGSSKGGFSSKGAYNLATKSLESASFRVHGYGKYAPSQKSKCLCGNVCTIAWD